MKLSCGSRWSPICVPSLMRTSFQLFATPTFFENQQLTVHVCLASRVKITLLQKYYYFRLCRGHLQFGHPVIQGLIVGEPQTLAEHTFALPFASGPGPCKSSTRRRARSQLESRAPREGLNSGVLSGRLQDGCRHVCRPDFPSPATKRHASSV